MMKSKKKKRISPVYRYIVSGIFVIYLLLLFKIVLFKHTSILEVIEKWAENEQRGYRSLNFIPFMTVKDFIEVGKNGQILRGISNILGNILIFAPLGYFLPFLYRGFRKIYMVFLAGLILSLFFEISQYICYLGSADIDDVVLNVSGACAGYGCYAAIDRLVNRKSIKYKITIALSLICFAGAFIVAREEFGTILGLKNYKVNYEGQEYIPDRSCDYDGTLISRENEVLTFYPAYVTEGSAEEDLLSLIEKRLTGQTRYVRQEIESDRKGATIRYRLMSEEEIRQIGKYSKVRIWLTDEQVDIVLLIHETEDSGGDIQSIESGESSVRSDGSGTKPEENTAEPELDEEKNEMKEIWGDITKFTDDGFVINMGISEELENGGSIAAIGVDDNMNLVTVNLLPDTIYRSKTIYDTLGEHVEEETASKEDLQVDQTVTLRGYTENGEFTAKEVLVSIFAFNN